MLTPGLGDHLQPLRCGQPPGERLRGLAQQGDQLLLGDPGGRPALQRIHAGGGPSGGEEDAAAPQLQAAQPVRTLLGGDRRSALPPVVQGHASPPRRRVQDVLLPIPHFSPS
ncbi:hypothetical protein JBE27_05405 [Streptomyces albiflaviniger]|nr:hypothetical protein [Streptomyces albiflaviniger]